MRTGIAPLGMVTPPSLSKNSPCKPDVPSPENWLQLAATSRAMAPEPPRFTSLHVHAKVSPAAGEPALASQNFRPLVVVASAVSKPWFGRKFSLHEPSLLPHEA